MKLTGILCAFVFVVALALMSRPAAAAAGSDNGPTLTAAKAVELAAAPQANKPKPPKDKEKKSKKNDPKDNDPDDGNAGGGNDGRTLPNDGPVND
jgi:hypothetical protein